MFIYCIIVQNPYAFDALVSSEQIVLSTRLKHSIGLLIAGSRSRIKSGREFQTVGPATEKGPTAVVSIEQMSDGFLVSLHSADGPNTLAGVCENVAISGAVSGDTAHRAGARTARPIRPVRRDAVIGARHVTHLDVRRPRIIAQSRRHDALSTQYRQATV